MEKLIGGILMAVGALIAGLSGLCSIAILFTSLASPSEWMSGGVGGAFGSLGIILMFGGIPFAVGAGLFLLGRRIARSARALPAEPSEPAGAPDTEQD